MGTVKLHPCFRENTDVLTVDTHTLNKETISHWCVVSSVLVSEPKSSLLVFMRCCTVVSPKFRTFWISLIFIHLCHVLFLLHVDNSHVSLEVPQLGGGEGAHPTPERPQSQVDGLDVRLQVDLLAGCEGAEVALVRTVSQVDAPEMSPQESLLPESFEASLALIISCF